MKRRIEALCAASVLCGACVARWGSLLAGRLTRVAARADALHAHAALAHAAARALDLAKQAATAAAAANSTRGAQVCLVLYAGTYYVVIALS